MSNSQHEIGATSNNDDVVGRNPEDEQEKAMVPYGMSLRSDVNITNCYEHCLHFFQKCTSITREVMFAYWMMAGYLGRVRSFQEARNKVWDTYRCLPIRLKSDGLQGIEYYEPVQCKHKGYCVLGNLGFVDLLDLDEIPAAKFAQDGRLFDLMGQPIEKIPTDNDNLIEYFTNFPTTPKPSVNLIMIEYFDHFHPTPKSLLENKNTNNLSVLLIRGCQFFPSRNIQNLTVLEISSSPRFTTLHAETISKLTRLRCLNLSNLPIQSLPDNFFHELRQLRWLIIRGCSKLCSIPSIAHLAKLVVLDLSHCLSLQDPIFLDIRYPQLQILDLSYTPIVYGFRELSAPNLTHLSLRGSKLKHLLLSGKPHNLPVPELLNLETLDLSSCEQLVSLSPLVNAPYLKKLNLSGCTSITNLLGLSDQMECLMDLDLSWTKVKHLPSFASLTSIRTLSLRGLELDSVETIASLSNSLVELDLSWTNVKHLPSFASLTSLCRLSLRGLELDSAETLASLSNLLVELDLSCTKVKDFPSFASLTSLRKLSLRGVELDSIETLASLPNMLVELDLGGLKISSSQVLELDSLKFLEKLEILNLSHTSVSKLPDMSKLECLKELLLADCQQLKVVPNLQAFKYLETLDLSFPDDLSIDNRQLEIEHGGQTNQISFPDLQRLRKLVLTNRSGIRGLFPKEALKHIKFHDLRGTDVADWGSELQAQQLQEIHSLFSVKSNQPSGFDHYEDVTIELNALILDIQKKFNSAMATTSTIDIDNHALKIQLEMVYADLRYILENIDGLKNSRNWNISDLLQELIDVAANLSAADFTVDSANFRQLSRLIVKLKLLVPPKQIDDLKYFEITKKKKKKKKSPLAMRKNEENNTIADIAKDIPGLMSDLLTSFKSLSNVHKHCLMCFSIFPYIEDGDKNMCGVKSLVIRKKILIHWWVGEGFIDPHQEENVDPNADTDPNKEMMMSTETVVRRDEVNEQVSATKEVKKPTTIEEIGEQILKVLVEKGFIEPVMKKGRESGSCRMHPFVHYFVSERAKEEGFFDFDRESCNLTPHFTRSQRACLLRPQASFPSSCGLWAKHVNSPKKLERFKTVKTLFNVNESMLDIKQEWFSKMKNLYVLYLGIWRSENTDLVEVADEKFLEDLKRMKELRLLSLQGLPTIMKLPDSVCQLSNLIILDLKECNYLDELPADIGSLKSLTHLDISCCPLITKLPKGISLLLKLEVLRGFVITDMYVARGSQDRNTSTRSRWWEKTKRSTIFDLFHHKKNEVCTLRDLLKLKRLRELSLVVNISMFPDDEELQVFKEMKQLRKLKILWERSVCTKDDIKSGSGQETSIGPSSQIGGDDTEESKHLDHIEKLELWCFPHENAPDWLNPSELKNLKKLYIVGGGLRKLPGLDTDENKWKVETMRLKYLCNLDIQWSELETMFPQLVYLEKHQCDRLSAFPCDGEGVWKSTS